MMPVKLLVRIVGWKSDGESFVDHYLVPENVVTDLRAYVDGRPLDCLTQVVRDGFVKIAHELKCVPSSTTSDASKREAIVVEWIRKNTSPCKPDAEFSASLY